MPQFAVWPQQIWAGSLCSVPVTSTAFYPSFLDSAGLPAKPEQHGEGVSLLPLFQGADGLHCEDIFWHYPLYRNQSGTAGSSIRSGDCKLIEFFEEGRIGCINFATILANSTTSLSSIATSSRNSQKKSNRPFWNTETLGWGGTKQRESGRVESPQSILRKGYTRCAGTSVSTTTKHKLSGLSAHERNSTSHRDIQTSTTRGSTPDHNDIR
ncbi:alkaline phosphatase family protein [Puniceicoccus vermicola]|uniref:hypothetical protein n=1 Tax=Puniceicoccus vermicola TaxID=388746 RepID=UPI00339533D6